MRLRNRQWNPTEFSLTLRETTDEETSFSTASWRSGSGGRRDALKEFLSKRGIPSMIYYPLPLQEQEAFRGIAKAGEELKYAEECSKSVLSLPMHTELTHEIQDYVIAAIGDFIRENC